MIITAKPRIPFRWMVLATLPWVAVIFKDKVMGIAFTFSMRKWVENPAALTFLLTIPWYISWVVPPVVNFVADRIWTRWGRRKPFIITSWVGTITSITCMPLAPDFGWLLVAYIAFSIFNDLGSPVESLKMEIVPPAQRATSAAVMSWVGQVAVLVFWVVAIGRFNEVTTIFGTTVTGEEGLFWSVSLGMVVMLLFLMLGIRETNPHSALLGQKFSVKNVFGGLFNNQLWPVYILAFSVAILGTGLGAFNLLLVTEQWGYTQQELGTNIFVGGILNLFLIPLLGLLANRVGRGNVYVGLVIAGIVVNAAMYSYYNFILYDSRPTLIEMIVFGEMLSIIGILTAMALTPFVYDFIPRNEMGTYAAGSGLVTRGTNILTASLMGVFVWGYASLFLGPPGEMARITLKNDTSQAEVQSLVGNATWRDPASGGALTSPNLTSRAWYATGASLKHGRCFEIRLGNDDSKILREQRDRLDSERSKHKVRKAYYQTKLRKQGLPSTLPSLVAAPATAPATGPASLDRRSVRAFADDLLDTVEQKLDAAIKAARRKSPEAELRAEAAAELAAENELGEAIKRLDDALEARAKTFEAQLKAVLGDRVMQDGQQVLDAAMEPAIIATFPLAERPHAEDLERTLDRLHKADAGLIDMRVVPEGDKFNLEISARVDPNKPADVAALLQKELTSACTDDFKSAFKWPPATPTTRPARAVRLDLRIIEDPLDSHPSPITRAVYKVMSIATNPPTPERRLNALGRGLRVEDVFDHAGAALVPGDGEAIRLLAVLSPPKPTTAPATRPTTAPAAAEDDKDKKKDEPSDAVQQRLRALMADDAIWAAKLYSQAVPAAREQRMTIAQPVLSAAYAKQQYDYLAGYIAVFIMQLIGLCIVFFFLYLVRKGRVRRRGAEEAEAIR